jgi:hypothetical protein
MERSLGGDTAPTNIDEAGDSTGCTVNADTIASLNTSAAPGGIDEHNTAVDPRLDEIAIIFDHVQLPPLEKAELAAEYVERAEKLFPRHDVKKSRGRPEGGISKAARELALPGKTIPARRKWLERALKIAAITPVAKLAAKKAEVARFQKALLEIANVIGEEAQLKIVAEIAERKRAGKKPVADAEFLEAVMRYPANRKSEVLAKLATFADEVGVEIV